MFEPGEPRLFGLPPGVDFAEALVAGIRARIAGAPPEAIARVTLFVNTQRMARHLRDLFDTGPAGFLPRIRLVTGLARDPASHALLGDIPAPVPPLRRRLQLTELVSALLDRAPDLAPRAALYDLADSLANLLDEMIGEGVAPADLAALEIPDSSGHWQRALAFLNLVTRYFDATQEPPDNEARQRMVVSALSALWAEAPPADPILIAGSTGSRGTTALFMKTVAALPQGAIILPGVDFDQPPAVWDAMTRARGGEDHPQFRFLSLARSIGSHPSEIRRWADHAPASPPRNALVSLALRPAPVTDQWLSDGPKLPDLAGAGADVTLLEAPTARDEAMAIALRLRQAAEDGRSAALITPDRMLTRQVAAALDRWGIVPDDSAGMPLPLSPPGRLMRLVGAFIGTAPTADALLALLKHPLTHRGTGRGPHLLRTRDLELHIRKSGMPFPSRADLLNWAETRRTDAGAVVWADWIFDALTPLTTLDHAPLTAFVDAHLHTAEMISRGADGAAERALWDGDAGEEARRVTSELQREARFGGPLSASDYTSLFAAVLNTGEVRDASLPHPGIRILGTMEARMQSADLTILAGLNEGTWPEPPAPDPWLNREMREKAGLLLPERRIGLSAHDFQQAIAGGEVWLTRSIRSEEAETVPSRWLSRLTNLLDGLGPTGGRDLLREMRGRGADWLALSAALEEPGTAPRAARPSPRPPAPLRPRQLSVTEISRLIRDPYAIYARHVLGLRRLDPIVQTADAPLRGTVIHDILDRFMRDVMADPEALSAAHLMAVAEAGLAADVPWPATRRFWRARMAKVADWFVEGERARREIARPLRTEVRGRFELHEPVFTLTAKADRIDADASGQLVLLDYKTGTPKTAKAQIAFEKQLLLEAMMAESGAFEGIAPAPVRAALYIGLGASPSVVPAPLEDEGPGLARERFRELIVSYLDPAQGFTARRAMEKRGFGSDYDTLSRYGEWDETQAPEPEDLA
ncbi:double-strand break repair protein AddB [Poseidonocella sedimentorum]|uniref:Double-strand break repair protein AddB n=1 Tax=Poseidonocella sedimentorum TaxID=871652 RepID=A0A1I6D7B2_9RHOB|nr:double-strand break repair protein AddB [Poseidonocella sedimentorum]SFR01192.1 double-strand break repair protein AddB [Poseidonocella sedimentorum]